MCLIFQVEEMEKKLERVMIVTKDQIGSLEEFRDKWDKVEKELAEIRSWMANAQAQLEALLAQSEGTSLADKEVQTRELSLAIESKITTLQALENKAQQYSIGEHFSSTSCM